MFTLPSDYTILFSYFEPYFTNRIWSRVQQLLIGAILAPSQRTVTAILRSLGLSEEKHFQNYHRILNRAVYSMLSLSRVLLLLLVNTFFPQGPILMGLDDTIERRRGAQIAAKGIYRDPVRSSHNHFVKASGLRWLSLMLLAPIPWAKRVWALPFLTVLSPSERFYQKQGRTPKKLTDWAEWMLLQVRRWLPERDLVVVADASFAVIEMLAHWAQLPKPITAIVRLRLDAALYAPPPPQAAGQRGRPRKKGQRLPTLAAVAADPQTAWQSVTIPNWYGQGERSVEIVSDTAIWYHSGLPPLPIRWVLIRDPLGKFKTQALLCTDVDQVEVTFHEVRTHLGVETQRQWSPTAIQRATPILMGLFSLVTLLAHGQAKDRPLPIRQTAWYHKQTPTFSDALALVRGQIWDAQHLSMSLSQGEMLKIPLSEIQPWFHALYYAL
jgi:hypothetical protein